MIGKKLNSSNKRIITRDWAALFPEFSVHSPMQLLRRCGPLLIGVCLDRDSSGLVYYPTSHVHCLVREFPGISLTLCRRLYSERNGSEHGVDVELHEQKYEEAAQRLERQFLGDLRGPLSFSDILEIYQNWIDEPVFRSEFQPEEIKDMVALCGWYDELERAESLARAFAKKMNASPKQHMEDAAEIDVWPDQLLKLAADREKLEFTMQKNIQDLRLSGIATTDLVGA